MLWLVACLVMARLLLLVLPEVFGIDRSRSCARLLSVEIRLILLLMLVVLGVLEVVCLPVDIISLLVRDYPGRSLDVVQLWLEAAWVTITITISQYMSSYPSAAPARTVFPKRFRDWRDIVD